MKVTPENYSTIKSALRRFLILEIKRHQMQFPSERQFDEALGHENGHSYKVLKRGSFTALERLWKECQEKLK